MTFSDADILIALYKGLLGREPDAKGMAFHLNQIEDGEALDALVSAFVNSMEFVQGFTSRANLYALDGAPPMEVDLDLTPEQSSRLWENVKQEWSRMGDFEPYHSVLADPKWASANMTSQEIVDAFYETGRGDMNRLDNWLARAGAPLPKTSICAEYGCGVGRSTIWLARRYERVLAMDISEPHLALARARAAKEGLTNIDFVHVRSKADLDLLRDTDLFYSQIVLQHNPPPLITEILSSAFAGLRPGGTRLLSSSHLHERLQIRARNVSGAPSGSGHGNACRPAKGYLRLGLRARAEDLGRSAGWVDRPLWRVDIDVLSDAKSLAKDSGRRDAKDPTRAAGQLNKAKLCQAPPAARMTLSKWTTRIRRRALSPNSTMFERCCDR